MGADKLLLVSKLKKVFDIYFYKWTFFYILKSKVVYLRPFLSSLPFPKFKNKILCTLGTNI